MWFELFMIACGLVVVVGVCGLLVDRYWLVWDWWPLVGWEWRAERHDRKQLERTRHEISVLVDPQPATWTDVLPHRPVPDLRAYNPVPLQELPEMAGPLTEDEADDSWADELHAINQELHSLPSPADGDPGNPPHSLVGGRAGEFGDLTRPVAELTHYEVEAVIVQLGRADWLPAAA